MVVGLLGGSFDPPHEGHVQITRAALARFALDRVWWLVSPGNPLKARGPAPLARRMEAARAMMHHPDVVVTDVEARIGTRYTYATLQRLKAMYPGVRFVWLMGSDNLVQFHRWDHWRWIMENVPVGVIARPGSQLAARVSPAALRYRGSRLAETNSRMLALRPSPVWCLVDVPLRPESSTAIRERGDWGWSQTG